MLAQIKARDAKPTDTSLYDDVCAGKRAFLHGKDSVTEYLTALMQKEILIFDGGMGTMIQLRKPDAATYAGDRYAEWPCSVKGNNDCLSITQPEMIKEIHTEYLEAGAELGTLQELSAALARARACGLDATEEAARALARSTEQHAAAEALHGALRAPDADALRSPPDGGCNGGSKY